LLKEIAALMIFFDKDSILLTILCQRRSLMRRLLSPLTIYIYIDIIYI
jgi:hypothetical protein